MQATAIDTARRRQWSSGERLVTPAIVVEVTRNEAAPAADTASTGGHRVTRCWFLRRFTAVAYLWRPTFAWAVGGPGRSNSVQIATRGERCQGVCFPRMTTTGAQSKGQEGRDARDELCARRQRGSAARRDHFSKPEADR